MTDWRRQGQEKYLKGAALSKQTYSKRRDDLEHDHCEFRGAKFSESREDLNDGYATENQYHWICENCFRDIHEEFQWRTPPALGDAGEDQGNMTEK